MARIFVIGLVVFASFGALAPEAYAAPALTPTKLEIAGWIPYWRKATGTVDVMPNIATLKEVNPFGYTVKTNGTLFDAAKMDEEPWVSLRAAAKANKVRFIPTVMWSNGAAIHEILSNTKTRIALEDEIAALVKEKGFDGIEIDFEGKKAETKKYFATFLKGLYQRMGNKWVICDIEARTPVSSRYEGTPPADATTYANDYVAINKYCDRVKIMAYDQGTIDLVLNKARAAPYIPVSDPTWVEKVVELTAQTISKKKIVIGVPTYGFEYQATKLSETGYRYDREWALNPGYATALAKSLGITPIRNSSGELSFIYKSSNQTAAAVTAASVGNATETNSAQITNDPNLPSTLYSQATIASAIPPPFNIVWWSDAQAIQQKIDLAKRLGVRGIAVFKLDGGQDPALWNVLKGI